MSSIAFAWLVTWTWQAVALTVVSTAVLRLAAGTNASTRYLVWWLTLAGVVLLAVVTMVVMTPMMPVATLLSWLLLVEPSATVEGGSIALAAQSSDTGHYFAPIHISPVPQSVIGVGAALWAAYSGRRAAALARSVLRLRAVRRNCAPVPASLERRLPLWMSVRSEGRRATLCVSEDLTTGCMLGLGSPLIALPRVLITSLKDTDIDPIVLHEYGHVQRRDDWATIAQASIEAVIGWHPAVWWIGRNLRLEREVACDDWVVRCTPPRDYAASLTRVAGLMLNRSTFPFASTALRSHHELAGRVERLLNPMRNVAVRPLRSVLAGGTAALGGAVIVLALTPPVVTVGVTDVSRTNLLPSVPVVAASGATLAPLVKSRRVEPVTTVSQTEPPTETSTARANATLSLLVGANQSTLLEHTELSALRGLAPPDDLRPVLVDRRPRPILTSSEFVVGTVVAVPVNAPNQGPTDLRDKLMTTESGPDPWGRLTRAGKAVGVGTAQVGIATASAFQTLGSSVGGVFGGIR